MKKLDPHPHHIPPSEVEDVRMVVILFRISLKNILMKTLCNFQSKFWKNIRKIVRKLQIILEKNHTEISKKFWNYLGCSLKFVQAVFMG